MNCRAITSLGWYLGSRFEQLEDRLGYTAPTAELLGGLTTPAIDLARAQTVYVPVYAHIYAKGSESLLLETTLSIRNTDPEHPITVSVVDYYDTKGQLLQNYLKEPQALRPRATAAYLVKKSDIRGWFGGEFHRPLGCTAVGLRTGDRGGHGRRLQGLSGLISQSRSPTEQQGKDSAPIQLGSTENELRVHLPKSLFMPVDCRDLLEVMQMQDSIADTAQDIAGLLVERPMEIPEPLLVLARRCVDTCEYSGKLIAELDELLETGLGGKEADRVEEMVVELNSMEGETDELGLKLAHILFEHEDSITPVSVIMWYRLIEWVGDLADYAEKVGGRLRLLIVR